MVIQMFIVYVSAFQYSAKEGQLVLSVKNSANMAIYQYFCIQFSKALILPTFWSVRIFEDQASAERAATDNYRAGNHYFLGQFDRQ